MDATFTTEEKARNEAADKAQAELDKARDARVKAKLEALGRGNEFKPNYKPAESETETEIKDLEKTPAAQ